MRVLDRYLLSEILRALLAILLILLITMLGFFLGDTLRDVARGMVPADLLLGQLGLRLLGSASVILPMAVFLAILLTLGRLHRDSEMVVMAACGLARYELYRPLAPLLVPGMILLLVLGVWVSPWTQRVAKAQVSRAAAELSVLGLQAGRFHTVPGRAGVVYVESTDGAGGFTGAFVHAAGERRDVVITARSGFQYTDPETGTRYLALLDGVRSEGTPGAADFRLMRFERSDLRIPQPQAGEASQRVDALPLPELLARGDPEARAEFHWRLAPACALLALVALAVPISRGRPREGYYGNLVLGILIYVIYANLLALGRTWIEQDRVPAGLGLWWLPAIGLVSAAMLLRSPHGRGARS